MNLQQEIKKRQPFESPEQEACLNLVRSSDLLQLDFTRLFREHGLSPPQYNVLRILRGNGGEGLPCLEIAARMIGSVPDITRLLDRLEAAGHIERARSIGDRRVVLVCIAPSGLKLLARLDKPVLELHQRQLGHLSRKELSQLNRLLLKARHAGPEALVFWSRRHSKFQSLACKKEFVMKAATLVARLLLGLAFTVFGANFFFHFIRMPPMPQAAKDLAGAMYASGYLMHVAHAIELVGGLLLLSGFFVPLALTLLGPVIVNIVLFDTLLAPGNAPLAIILAALEVFLIWRYGSYFRPLFTVRAAAS